MRAIPGEIFPIGSYDKDPVLVTPVALALRRRDIKILQLFVRHPLGRELMCKRRTLESSGHLIVSLFLNILREDETFFETDDMICWTESADSVNLVVAKVFKAVENNDPKKVKGLLNSLSFEDLELVKNTYISSQFPMFDVEDLNTMSRSKQYLEKSLVLIALENKNLEMLEYLEERGFDITNLGNETQYPINDRKQNNMFLWYLLIKQHLQNENLHFVYTLTQKPQLWHSPAFVGCLYMAAVREGLQTMKLISKYFESTWFTGPKYQSMTAYSLLLKHGF